MSNMSYVRHENTLRDLNDVWERWRQRDGRMQDNPGYMLREPLSDEELQARAGLIYLIAEMHAHFVEDGVVDSDGSVIDPDIHDENLEYDVNDEYDHDDE